MHSHVTTFPVNFEGYKEIFVTQMHKIVATFKENFESYE